MKVTVVGAGIVGYAIAYELAARGAQVHVVDARGTGQGATRASAGILAPYIEGHSTALLHLGLCSLEQYDSFVARVATDARRAVEYRRTGTLQVALTEEEARQLERQGRTLADAGVNVTYVEADEARRLEPALATSVRAALLVPEHGYVGAATLVAALAQAASSRGVSLSIARVRAIGRANGALTVDTSGDSLIADAVVLAAGSWSGGIPMTPAAPPPVRPVRGQLLHLRLPDAPLSHVVWGTGSYLVPWQDGSVLVGATVEDVGFDERVTVAGVRELLDAGERLVPAVRSAIFEEARAGLRPATADELPIVGPSSTMRGVYYATGHYRSGVLLAPLTAMIMADLLITGNARRELELVRPDRFGL